MSIVSKPPPKGWPRISASLTYEKAAPAIDWLCKAFGFEIQLMVGDARRDERPWQKSPKQLDGANTQTQCIFVDDADAHCERARAAGAKIATEPKTSDYGEDYWSDRSYEAIDPEGHHWWFMQRMREKS